MILDRIDSENDIKKIDPGEYDELAAEIRSFLVDHVSETGGHLASNLGAVELTMALHLCMDFPKDKLIWDVGHQAYTHKLLTGRKEGFDTLRKEGGMSGFPKMSESDADAFDTGHSSTSISAALGYAEARKLKGGSEKIVAVIGDGAFSNGMAFEALNNMSHLKENIIVILNDNEMSISHNVGAMSKYLNKIRLGSAYNGLKIGVEDALMTIPIAGEKIAKKLKQTKDSMKQFVVPGKFFEDLGISYIGPVNGHDVTEMVETFSKAFKLKHPILIHVKTKKGMGYSYAEKHPDYFHGIEPFDKKTGKVLSKPEVMSYSGIFARKLTEMAAGNKSIVAVTAAMPDGTGLSRFGKAYPSRLFDVGIAEEHAVTFAAGMAAAGLTPVVAIYSSFLQRAYDQILHDVCLMGLHVIFGIDRAGFVGSDGETHQGLYDISYLNGMPGMTIMAPKNRYEMSRMLEFAVDFDGPIAIRYPKDFAYYELKNKIQYIELGKSEVLERGERLLILAVGSMVKEAVQVVERLKEEGYAPTLINVRFVKPFDITLYRELISEHDILCTMEEGMLNGGFGQTVSGTLLEEGYSFRWIPFAVKDIYVKQATRARQMEENCLSPDTMSKVLIKALKGNDNI
ncbi:MAG: 1-deoxy-D-xylulose-5-phosphate synthase [Lachnospiraceae bacterium]|nr:1-deoxy-D-xylulose-5-phosphate synthase [Lachnospiraceae bacterium]